MQQSNFLFVGVDGRADSAAGGDADSGGNTSVVGGGIGDTVSGVIGWRYLWWCWWY